MAVLSNRTETIAALKLVPLFDPLAKKDLNEIARRSEEAEVPKGTILAQEGRRGTECFLILEGSAVVRRKLRQVGTVGPGDVFGEMSLIDGEPQSMTVQMMEPSVVLVIQREDFSDLIRTMPGFAAKLLAGLTKRLRASDDRLLG